MRRLRYCHFCSAITFNNYFCHLFTTCARLYKIKTNQSTRLYIEKQNIYTLISSISSLQARPKTSNIYFEFWLPF